MGHGNSNDPPREYEVEDFTRSTAQFIDAIGVEKAHIAGNHSGAALALSITVTYPERVKKLALSGESCTPAGEINAFLESLKAKPLSRELPMTEDGHFLVEAWERYNNLSPRSEPAVRLKPFIIGMAARLRTYDAHHAVLRWMARENRLPKVKCPTLLFIGAEDIFFNRARLESAKSSMLNCQTAVFEGAGAMICFEKPQELTRTILAFLQS